MVAGAAAAAEPTMVAGAAAAAEPTMVAGAAAAAEPTMVAGAAPVDEVQRGMVALTDETMPCKFFNESRTLAQGVPFTSALEGATAPAGAGVENDLAAAAASAGLEPAKMLVSSCWYEGTAGSALPDAGVGTKLEVPVRSNETLVDAAGLEPINKPETAEACEAEGNAAAAPGALPPTTAVAAAGATPTAAADAGTDDAEAAAAGAHLPALAAAIISSA